MKTHIISSMLSIGTAFYAREFMISRTGSVGSAGGTNRQQWLAAGSSWVCTRLAWSQHPPSSPFWRFVGPEPCSTNALRLKVEPPQPPTSKLTRAADRRLKSQPWSWHSTALLKIVVVAKELHASYCL
jgi:hypothetical protein